MCAGAPRRWPPGGSVSTCHLAHRSPSPCAWYRTPRRVDTPLSRIPLRDAEPLPNRRPRAPTPFRGRARTTPSHPGESREASVPRRTRSYPRGMEGLMTHRISRRTRVFCAGLGAGVLVPLTVAATPATAADTAGDLHVRPAGPGHQAAEGHHHGPREPQGDRGRRPPRPEHQDHLHAETDPGLRLGQRRQGDRPRHAALGREEDNRYLTQRETDSGHRHDHQVGQRGHDQALEAAGH